MKKLNVLFCLLLTVSFFKAQTILTTVQSYQNLKASGQLLPQANYKFINNATNTNPGVNQTKGDLTLGMPSAAKTNSTGACQCMVPVDPTFSVVPITSGIAPEYRNDDGSTALIPLGFSFCFYGTTYTSCYINNNGNISFGSPYSTFSSNPFPDPGFVMIAPFWGDVDTRNASSGLPYFKKTATSLIVKWSNVGYYSSMADKLNDFQLIITDGSDPILPNGNNVAFCYGDMQWTTGSASQGVGGFGGVPSTVGVNKGDGTNFVQIGRFDAPGISYDGPYGLNDGVSFLDNKSYFFNTCGTNNNLPPIVQDATGGGSSCGDTLKICSLGDTLVYTTTFLAPESTQSITINGTAATLGSNFQPLGVTTTTAGTTIYTWMVVASPTLTGVHTVVITGTDNGTPPLSTSATYFIKIENLSIPQPTLSSSPSGTVCATPGATLNLINCSSYDNVYWSNGTSGCSTIANTTGVYYVTVKKTGCYKSSSDTIQVFPNPVPVVLGPLNYCPPATSTTLSLNPPLPGMAAYNTYTWTPGPVNTPTAALNGTFAGKTYTVKVTDANGCTGFTTFTVSTASPTVGITANPTAICGTGTTTLTASISGATSYSWSNGGTAQTTTVNAAGVYSVTVLANNCTSTQTINVNITPTPSVVITPSLNLCAGSSGTVSVVSFTPAGVYTYTWSDGTHSPFTTVSANSVISLLVTNNTTGCVSDTSNKCIVTISSNPIPTPSVFGALNYCPPATSTTLALNPPASGMPAYDTYTWTPGAINTPTASLTGTTNYTVSVTDVNGCTGSVPFVVSASSPTVGITANPLSICGAGTTTLTASISGATSYSWTGGGTAQTTTVTSAGIYTVTVDANNCIATASINVNISPTPTVVIPASVSMCSGTSNTVAAISFSPAGVYTYTWSNGVHTPSLTVTTPTVLTLQVTNSTTGCVSLVSNTCTVIAVPNPTVSMSALPVIFCNGFNATLTPTVTAGIGGSTSYSYAWTPSALGTAATATTSTQGNYAVIVTDANLCVGMATVATVKSSPSVSLFSPDFVICPGDCAEITATGTSSFTPYSYAWSNNSSTADSTLMCTAGNVSVTFMDAQGCIATNTTTVFNDVIPVASFTATPPSPVTPTTVIDFTSTSTISTGSITSTSWTFGDGNGANGNPVNHFYTMAGTFPVVITVTGSSGCSDRDTLWYVVDAVIEVPNVFTPNGDGANELLKFKNLELLGSNHLTIFNRWGKKVFEQDNYKNDWNGGGHTDGTYFFILTVPEATPNHYEGYVQLMR
ncbi:MAG: gliding motility-associated C-terminal domain-containing protein [Bacteroidota bacterium]